MINLTLYAEGPNSLVKKNYSAPNFFIMFKNHNNISYYDS